MPSNKSIALKITKGPGWDRADKTFKNLNKLKDRAIFEALTEVGEKAREEIKTSLEKGINPALSQATLRIGSRKSGLPLIKTGKLLNSINYKVSKKQLRVGILNPLQKSSSGKLSMQQLVEMQEKGYVIPADNSLKGQRVRAFLRANGIIIPASKQFLIVPPRPFITPILKKYNSKMLSQKVVEKFKKYL